MGIQIEWINLWLGPLALGPINMSILFFYRRIFDARQQGLFHTTLLLLIGLLSVWTIAFFFVMLFMCGSTFSNLWGNYLNLHTLCSNGNALLIDEAFSISDFCLDVIVFILPLPKVSWYITIFLQSRVKLLDLVTAYEAPKASACDFFICYRCSVSLIVNFDADRRLKLPRAIVGSAIRMVIFIQIDIGISSESNRTRGAHGALTCNSGSLGSSDGLSK